MKRSSFCILLLACASGAYAQQPQATPPAPPKSISSSLGLHAFPAKNQTATQQKQDETACYNWAKQDTGFDPMAAQSAQQTAPPQNQQPPQKAQTAGAGAKGAASGAAKGAVVGAISGNAGEGAAVGAATGAVGGRLKARRAKKQADEKAKQQQAQAKEKAQQNLDGFKKGFSACMEAKGYVVK